MVLEIALRAPRVSQLQDTPRTHMQRTRDDDPLGIVTDPPRIGCTRCARALANGRNAELGLKLAHVALRLQLPLQAANSLKAGQSSHNRPHLGDVGRFLLQLLALRLGLELSSWSRRVPQQARVPCASCAQPWPWRRAPCGDVCHGTASSQWYRPLPRFALGLACLFLLGFGGRLTRLGDIVGPVVLGAAH